MVSNRRWFIAAVTMAMVDAVVCAGSIDLPIVFGNSYAAVEIAIGSPPVAHRLFFDTGSSTTWVYDQICAATCSNGSGYKRIGYNASASSTATSLNAHGSIAYFGGITAGNVISDQFKISSSTSNLTWTQTFLSANQSSWSFMYADGFLGLAFSSIAVPKTTTVMETLMQASLVDLPRFGIYYGTELKNTVGKIDGVLTLGGSKEDVYVDGEITYIPLRNESQYQVWRTPLSSITGTQTINGTDTSATQFLGGDGRAVFDTGAGAIQIPPSQINSIYDSIGFNYTSILSGRHIPQCSEFNSSWSITFDFSASDLSSDNLTITLSGEELKRPGFAGTEETCFPPFESSGIEGFALIGTPFLHRFYSVWDFGGFDVESYAPRVGFGKLKAEYKT